MSTPETETLTMNAPLRPLSRTMIMGFFGILVTGVVLVFIALAAALRQNSRIGGDDEPTESSDSLRNLYISAIVFTALGVGGVLYLSGVL